MLGYVEKLVFTICIAKTPNICSLLFIWKGRSLNSQAAKIKFLRSKKN